MGPKKLHTPWKVRYVPIAKKNQPPGMDSALSVIFFRRFFHFGRHKFLPSGNQIFVWTCQKMLKSALQIRSHVFTSNSTTTVHLGEGIFMLKTPNRFRIQPHVKNPRNHTPLVEFPAFRTLSSPWGETVGRFAEILRTSIFR